MAKLLAFHFYILVYNFAVFYYSNVGVIKYTLKYNVLFDFCEALIDHLLSEPKNTILNIMISMNIIISHSISFITPNALKYHV